MASSCAQESEEWEGWIKAAFDAFDVDGSGRLNTDHLNSILCGEVCEVHPHAVSGFQIMSLRGTVQLPMRGRLGTCAEVILQEDFS
jgi:hypothetical protein